MLTKLVKQGLSEEAANEALGWDGDDTWPRCFYWKSPEIITREGLGCVVNLWFGPESDKCRLGLILEHGEEVAGKLGHLCLTEKFTNGDPILADWTSRIEKIVEEPAALERVADEIASKIDAICGQIEKRLAAQRSKGKGAA
jgi:hypothetical protein